MRLSIAERTKLPGRAGSTLIFGTRGVSPAHFGDHGPAWLFVAGGVQEDRGLRE